MWVCGSGNRVGSLMKWNWLWFWWWGGLQLWHTYCQWGLPEVDRGVEVKVGSCRHLVSRQHQVLSKEDTYSFHHIKSKTLSCSLCCAHLAITPWSHSPTFSYRHIIMTSEQYLFTIARHFSPIWPKPKCLFHKGLEVGQPEFTMWVQDEFDNYYNYILVLRQTSQEFPMWSAHHLTPDISSEFV